MAKDGGSSNHIMVKNLSKAFQLLFIVGRLVFSFCLPACLRALALSGGSPIAPKDSTKVLLANKEDYEKLLGAKIPLAKELLKE